MMEIAHGKSGNPMLVRQGIRMMMNGGSRVAVNHGKTRGGGTGSGLTGIGRTRRNMLAMTAMIAKAKVRVRDDMHHGLTLTPGAKARVVAK